MRHELTDNQRTYIAEYIGQQQPTVQPVQVHNHIYGGGAQQAGGFSVMAFLGALAVGVIGYSLWSGVSISDIAENAKSTVMQADISFLADKLGGGNGK